MTVFFDAYVTPHACELLWQLLRERPEEAAISHSKMPTRIEHERFFQSRPYPVWVLAKRDGGDTYWLGAVNVTTRNEVGIFLFESQRGQGHGRRVLADFLAAYRPMPAIRGERPGDFLANINPRNERSIRLFTGQGFELIQQTYRLKRC